MIEDTELTRFLEAALKSLFEDKEQPCKVVLAYITKEGVNMSYKNCSYMDLQYIGQELINHGLLRFIAYNDDKMQRFREEANAGDSSDNA